VDLPGPKFKGGKVGFLMLTVGFRQKTGKPLGSYLIIDEVI
jgi:hypothetical protein